MRKERKIINTNIRLNLLDEKDRMAWEYLQNMDRKKYKSYTRAVVIALNDFFPRQEKLEKDPFLETRQKEDEFLKRVEEAVERGARESMPLVLAGKLLGALKPAMVQVANVDTEVPIIEKDASFEKTQEQEEAEEAALDFADGF